MKNVHLIPTDKPSRLADMEGLLVFGKDFKSPIGHPTMYLYQHIYITNSEIPKEGDWVIETLNRVIFKVKNNTNDYYNSTFKKIILTTDQDLISDGVQAIDDEFLEWFVKNPSCESVEIKMENYYASGALQPNLWQYKIIIPQEEPETSYVKSETKFLGIEFTLKDGFKQFIPKQETLEEAADKYGFRVPYDGSNDFYDKEAIKHFIAGAKWQAERMYSEEDLRKAYFSGISSTGEGWNGEYANGNNPNIEEKFSEGFEKWFEQFKKK